MIVHMGRWEPGARGRLARAALELYLDPGFEQTTVADIAARAGVTERTFFRHFADKREVLFAGSGALQEGVVAAIADAPDDASPLEAMAIGMDAAGAAIQGGQPDAEFPRLRAAVIAANPSLQERELLKLATLTAAAADALRARGVADPVAAVVAETGMAAFKLGFERWVAEASADLPSLIRSVLGELRSLA